MLPDKCDLDIDVCCPSYFAFGETLLAAAYTDLSVCLPQECGELDHFVSLGKPQTMLQNYVAVWLEASRLRPSQQQRDATAYCLPLFRQYWRVRFLQSNYPTVHENENDFWSPPAQDVHAANRLMYSFGERMHRSVIQAWQSGLFGQCAGLQIGDFTPILPGSDAFGSSAGFEFAVGIDVDM